MAEYLYRYVDGFNGGSGYGNPSLCRFRIIKETPCGYWFKEVDFFHVFAFKKKWTSKTSKRRFAYPTKQEAAKAYAHRKAHQIGILRGQLKKAEVMLKAANLLAEGKELPEEMFRYSKIFEL